MTGKSKKRIALIAAIVLCLSVATGVTALAAPKSMSSGTVTLADAANQQTAVSTDAADTTESADTEDNSDVLDTEENDPSYTGSIALGTQDNTADETETQGSEEQEDASLAAKATITAAQAVDAVKAAFPDATVSDAQIGDENGYLIYEVQVTQADGTLLEVKVDAGNGTILAQESDSEDNGSSVEEADSGSDTDNIEWEEEGDNETEN